jgi:hypothetical protein
MEGGEVMGGKGRGGGGGEMKGGREREGDKQTKRPLQTDARALRDRGMLRVARTGNVLRSHRARASFCRGRSGGGSLPSKPTTRRL